MEIAISGTGFFKSGSKMKSLLVRNSAKLSGLDMTCAFLFFLGRVVTTLGSGIASYYFFSLYFVQTPLNFAVMPVILNMIVAYSISSTFFFVYHMAVDSIFISYCVDCEKNDGSARKPHLMSKNMKKIEKIQDHGNKVISKNEAFVEDL